MHHMIDQITDKISLTLAPLAGGGADSPYPLPDFLDRSKLAADIDAKLLVPSSESF